MKKKKLVNTWRDYPGPQKEKFTLPSLTIPDQTLSLKDLLSRYVRGADVPVFEPVFIDDDSGVPINLEKMTKQEKIDLARAAKADVQKMQAELQKKQAEKVSDAEEKPEPKPKVSSKVEDVEGV